jgi:hypothetical protein
MTLDQATIWKFVVVTNAMTILATISMNWWKGWGVFTDDGDLDKRGWIVLAMVMAPPVAVLTYLVPEYPPNTLLHALAMAPMFLFWFVMQAGIYVVLPAMLTEFFLELFWPRPTDQYRPPDDRGPCRPKPKSPVPTQGLTLEQRLALYDKLYPKNLPKVRDRALVD